MKVDGANAYSRGARRRRRCNVKRRHRAADDERNDSSTDTETDPAHTNLQTPANTAPFHTRATR